MCCIYLRFGKIAGIGSFGVFVKECLVFYVIVLIIFGIILKIWKSYFRKFKDKELKILKG